MIALLGRDISSAAGKPNVRPQVFLGRAMAFAALLVCAACSGTFPPTPSTGTAESKVGFNPYLAQDTFIAGFDTIERRYIDPVAMDVVGLEAIRGLSALDPNIQVTREGAVLRLKYDDVVQGDYPLPKHHTALTWAALAGHVTSDVRTASVDIRATTQERVYEAIFDGALSELDVFSRYAGRDQARKQRDRREGFGGIGVRFSVQGGHIHITRVQKGSPADRAGIRVGDTITHVNGTSFAEDATLADVSRVLRGMEGSSLIMSVTRDDTSGLNFVVTRAHVVPETVFVEAIDGIAVLRITSFNRRTAVNAATALKRLRATATLRGIVLDLRGNPGGLLKQSVKLADLFLTNGVILRTQGRHPSSFQHYEAGGDDLAVDLPIVVMIDGLSASASEIVAAALQDQGRAVVLGTASYGKGSVQSVVRLPNDGELTLTWSRFVTPSGYSLHGLGVMPTFCTSAEDNPNRAIAQATSRDQRLQKTLREWRYAKRPNKTERLRLRRACAAETRTVTAPAPDTDLVIAKRLIQNADIYRHALNLAVVPDTATAAVPTE